MVVEGVGVGGWGRDDFFIVGCVVLGFVGVLLGRIGERDGRGVGNGVGKG